MYVLQLMKFQPHCSLRTAWERYFQTHLDQKVAQSSGKFGEGSGRGRNHSCKSAHTNTSSAPENPEVVEKFLQSKQAVARMVQVPEPESVKSLHTMQPGQSQ